MEGLRDPDLNLLDLKMFEDVRLYRKLMLARLRGIGIDPYCHSDPENVNSTLLEEASDLSASNDLSSILTSELSIF
jgi:hypothetical protein